MLRITEGAYVAVEAVGYPISLKLGPHYKTKCVSQSDALPQFNRYLLELPNPRDVYLLELIIRTDGCWSCIILWTDICLSYLILATYTAVAA
jgi:hypothetical protein